MSTQFQFPSDFQKFIYKSRYARWIQRSHRRENWPETIDRYINFFIKHLKTNNNFDLNIFPDIKNELRDSILTLKIVPSMRALFSAGKALFRDNCSGYNCAYCSIDTIHVFSEILYILTCGTGVGFSVERQYINKLPEITDEFYPTDTIIKVHDSKIG